MGEQADLILNGEDCQECGQALLVSHGYPVTCKDCGGTARLCVDASDEELKAAGWEEAKPVPPKDEESEIRGSILHARQKLNCVKKGTGHYDGSQGIPQKIRVDISELKILVATAELYLKARKQIQKQD